MNTRNNLTSTTILSEIEISSNNSQEVKKFPISYLLAFIGYTIILMIEKILFDTHDPIQEEEEEEEEEDDDEDEEKDPYPLFELKEEFSNIFNGENITKPCNKSDLQSFKKKESVLRSASTIRNSINKEFNSGQSYKTKNYRKSVYNLTKNTNLNYSVKGIQEGKLPTNQLNIQSCSNKIDLEKENFLNTTPSKPSMKLGTQFYRAGESQQNDGRFALRSAYPSKHASISNNSKQKRDRINTYLECYKIDSVEKKEQEFKNLFSAVGKMSFILKSQDCKIS